MGTNWSEIESILLPNIIKARKEPSDAESVPRDYLSSKKTENGDVNVDNQHEENGTHSSNVYESDEAKNVIDAINFRLDLSIHKCTTTVSTMNTLKYLFFFY